MQPTQNSLPIGDFNLSYYQWGKDTDPVILLVHATGMHGRIWDQMIKSLPAGYRIIAVDLRGHGQSRWDGHLLDWSLMGNDLTIFIEALDLKDIIGAGHSMGGHVLTQAALALQSRFKRLVLIDPVLFAPEYYKSSTQFEIGDPKDNPISRRRNHFKGWQELYDLFKTRIPYSGWDRRVMEDYCRYGVKDRADGGYALACDPHCEASVYMGHFSVDLSEQVKKLTLPVTILRAKQATLKTEGKIDFLASPTWPDLAGNFANATDVYLPELSHFIPMQEPALVAGYIASEAD